MCIAVDYANEINKQITEAKEYYNKLRIKDKVFNDVQQDLLHKIEGLEKFSLYTGWKFCKALNKLRKARRTTKNELKTMELLIKQLGGFSIKESNINGQANSLEKLNFENGYHKRQLEMTGDILEEVENIVNNIVYSKKASDDLNEFNSDESKIYEASERVPKFKGSNIKLRYTSEKNKNNVIENRKSAYKRYIINEKEQYIEFIDRKKSVTNH